MSIRTHWEGCFAHHMECAQAKISELLAELSDCGERPAIRSGRLSTIGRRVEVPSVYLAGPFSTDDEHQWREEAREVLGQWGIDTESPMLLSEYCRMYGVDEREAALVLTARDYKFATGCDAILANFQHTKHASIGTCIELGWANANGVPIIAVVEDGNVHEHPIVLSLAKMRVHSLHAGLRSVAALLAPSHWAAGVTW